MLAVIGLAFVICVLLVLNVMHSFRELLARLEKVEERLDALSESNPDDSGLVEKLPPPDADF
jgi:hypothetical protein